MEPGEVMIVSPGSGTDNTALHDEAKPGTNLTDASGISTTWMPTTIGMAQHVDACKAGHNDGQSKAGRQGSTASTTSIYGTATLAT